MPTNDRLQTRLRHAFELVLGTADYDPHEPNNWRRIRTHTELTHGSALGAGNANYNNQYKRDTFLTQLIPALSVAHLVPNLSTRAICPPRRTQRTILPLVFAIHTRGLYHARNLYATPNVNPIVKAAGEFNPELIIQPRAYHDQHEFKPNQPPAAGSADDLDDTDTTRKLEPDFLQRTAADPHPEPTLDPDPELTPIDDEFQDHSQSVLIHPDINPHLLKKGKRRNYYAPLSRRFRANDTFITLLRRKTTTRNYISLINRFERKVHAPNVEPHIQPIIWDYEGYYYETVVRLHDENTLPPPGGLPIPHLTEEVIKAAFNTTARTPTAPTAAERQQPFIRVARYITKSFAAALDLHRRLCTRYCVEGILALAGILSSRPPAPRPRPIPNPNHDYPKEPTAADWVLAYDYEGE